MLILLHSYHNILVLCSLVLCKFYNSITFLQDMTLIWILLITNIAISFQLISWHIWWINPHQLLCPEQYHTAAMQSVIHNWTQICRQIVAQRNQILPRIPFSSHTSSSFLHNWPCPSQQLVNCGAEQQSRKLCQAFPSRPHFLRPCPFLVISSSQLLSSHWRQIFVCGTLQQSLIGFDSCFANQPKSFRCRQCGQWSSWIVFLFL